MRDLPQRKPRHVVVVDHSELNRAIGDRVKMLRRRRKMTQKEVAGERFTAAYISALERGLTHPSLSALAHIAERLQVRMRDLLPKD